MSVDDNSATISWMSPNPPNGVNVITGYRVQYRRIGDSSYTGINHTEAANLIYTITGLMLSNNEYECRVSAFTVVGEGNFTTPLTIRAGEVYTLIVMLLLLLTDSPPTITAAIVLSPHSIRITWIPPMTSTVTITGYTIMWDAKEIFADDTDGSKTVTSTTRTYDLDGLEEFVTYDITVNAVSDSGPGPFSDVVRLRTFSDSKYK